jgi:hypothetical protein
MAENKMRELETSNLRGSGNSTQIHPLHSLRYAAVQVQSCNKFPVMYKYVHPYRSKCFMCMLGASCERCTKRPAMPSNRLSSFRCPRRKEVLAILYFQLPLKHSVAIQCKPIYLAGCRVRQRLSAFVLVGMCQ